MTNQYDSMSYAPNLYLQKALISKLSSCCGPHGDRNCSDIVP